MSDDSQITVASDSVTPAVVVPVDDGLSVDQRRAMEMLVAGRSITSVARDTGLARTTIYNWLKKDAQFRAAHNLWLESKRLSCQSRLMGLTESATDVVEFAIKRCDEKIAMQLLKGLGMMPGKAEELNCQPEQIERDDNVRKLEKNVDLLQRELSALKSPVPLLESAVNGKWYVMAITMPPHTIADLYNVIHEMRRPFMVKGPFDPPLILIECSQPDERIEIAKELIDRGYDANPYFEDANSEAIEDKQVTPQ